MYKIPTSTEIFSSYLINDRYILDQFCPISSKKETYILLEKINYMKTDQIRVQIKDGDREERREGKKGDNFRPCIIHQMKNVK